MPCRARLQLAPSSGIAASSSGTSSGFDLCSRSGPGCFISEGAPLIVEVLDGPPEPSNEAESVGSFYLLVPSGELVMEESGGGGGEAALSLPPGEWRARWSGFGETAAEEREYTEQLADDPPSRSLRPAALAA